MNGMECSYVMTSYTCFFCLLQHPSLACLHLHTISETREQNTLEIKRISKRERKKKKGNQVNTASLGKKVFKSQSNSHILFLSRIWIKIVLAFSGFVFTHKINDDRPGLIELAQPVRKRSFLFVLLQEGVTLPQPVILLQCAFEQSCNRGVVRQHQSADTMRVLQVRRFLRKGDLDTRWSPWDKGRQTPFADAQ